MRQVSQTLLFCLPLVFLTFLVAVVWHYWVMPSAVGSALYQQAASPTPIVQLPDLLNQKKPFSTAELRGKVSILQTWASWCPTCAAEEPVLMKIAQQQHIPIYGLDYKDNTLAARRWLKQHGQPFKAVGFDANGLAAVDLNATKVPETLIVDKGGVIRQRYAGVLTEQVWRNQLLPEVKKLQGTTVV